MRQFFLRVFNTFSRTRLDTDLDRELRSHLEMLEDEYQRRGMTLHDARIAARRAMGSSALAKDLHRDARSVAWLEDLGRDMRHGVRALCRNAGFTAAAVLTLALGIGANTAIFSVIDAVLVRPLPYPDANRLVYLLDEAPAADGGTRGRRPAMDVQTLAEFRTQTRTLSGVSVQQSTTAAMDTGEEIVRLNGSKVSPAFLTLLGARPVVGRILESRDEAAGNDAVMLLGQAAWERYFASTPDIAGRPVTLDGRRYSIVGVVPADFHFFPDPEAEFWTPLVLPTSELLMAPIVARLNDGVTPEAALNEMTTILQQLRPSSEQTRFAIVSVQDQMVAPARRALLVLAGAVVFVLLIACVNVANLVLARRSTRQREVAIRGALGAGRRRIAALFLAESLVIAAAGGVAGVALAIGGVRLLRVLGANLPRPEVGSGVSIPRLAEIVVDAPMLIFAAAVSLGAGVLFGVLPVLGWRGSEPVDALRGYVARSGAPAMRGDRFRRLLVVGEIGLAMMLLVGAALMASSFARLAMVNPGYDGRGVLTFQATLPDSRDMASFAEQLVARLESLPGVRAAGYSTDRPMVRGRGRFSLSLTPDRKPPAPGQPTADPNYVSRDYLKAMGIQVVSGRGFEDTDRLGSPQVMLVNRSLARSGMVGTNPIGTRVYALFRNPWEIVGMVDDIRAEALDEDPYPQFFVDLRQVPGFPFSEFRPYFAVRTDGDTAALLGSVRGIVRQIEPRASIDNLVTLERLVWSSISRPRLYAVLLAVFATVAVALAAIGIFGLMRYLVEQRTREIGIRMALGARRSAVLSAVLRQSGVLIVSGVSLGLGAAAALTRYLQGMLFGVTPLDPATFAAASAFFMAVALAASYGPARRATRVDPLAALRTE